MDERGELTSVSTHQIHIFISHSWTYSRHYETLHSWIFGKRWSVGQASLAFRDFSVPRDDPIHNAPSLRALRDAIYRKIDGCHVVVCPTGMYANYSDWIQKELDGAQVKGKPILGVDPWGQGRRSSVVAEAAQSTVGWNSKSVVDGIWNSYLGR